ncbi:rCG50000, isoform CRA_c [Rattus norvegicus]|uniref:RCG50000, isoform CRA_c n=1 Tax=Rattus norvegicus TaxID=10116 RepID=A6JV58_RAT|nr:protein MGARP [Rattus norvegicus]EDM14994.1 rCG50000, isoform CRA_c [Rattus norvegicus]|eukprot:NP_001103026.1 protein MGARP [Rattus norvegicus]
MYLRRAVSKTLALPRRAPPGPAPLGKDASLRRVSSSKFPGPSGSNMIYYLVVGVTVSAGGYYTYKAFTSKQVRHTEHVTDPKEQTKAELQPLPGETEHVAEAGKACSETGEISVKESDSVDAEEVPEAAAVLPEESQASASEVPAEAALVETSVLSSEPELKITDDHDASPVETTEGVPESPPEVEGAAPDQADVCSEGVDDNSKEGAETSKEGAETSKEEAETSKEAEGTTTADAEEEESAENAELEESPPLTSEPSAQPESQEETEVTAEAASPQG